MALIKLTGGSMDGKIFFISPGYLENKEDCIPDAMSFGHCTKTHYVEEVYNLQSSTRFEHQDNQYEFMIGETVKRENINVSKILD